MKFGELIKKYIDDHGLTYKEFADRTGISKGYVSMLIADRNPKTGKPPIPTIKTYNNVAIEMGMTLDELFRTIEDAPVSPADLDEAGKHLQAIGKELAALSGSKEVIILTHGFSEMQKHQKPLFKGLYTFLTTTFPDTFKERDDDDDTKP